MESKALVEYELFSSVPGMNKARKPKTTFRLIVLRSVHAHADVDDARGKARGRCKGFAKQCLPSLCLVKWYNLH